jgi:hypothetical protein
MPPSGEGAGPVAGTLMRTSPTSVRTVFALDPLRTFPVPDRSPRSWPKCPLSSTSSAVPRRSRRATHTEFLTVPDVSHSNCPQPLRSYPHVESERSTMDDGKASGATHPRNSNRPVSGSSVNATISCSPPLRTWPSGASLPSC